MRWRCVLGPILLEDVPDRQTTMAKALTRSLDCTFHRSSSRHDLLRANHGTSIYNNSRPVRDATIAPFSWPVSRR